jgi:Lar family restriction alleviation protein
MLNALVEIKLTLKCLFAKHVRNGWSCRKMSDYNVNIPTDKLKPCPFCGAPIKFYKHYLDENSCIGTTVLCISCGAQLSVVGYTLFESINSAINAWNSRVTL